MKRFASAITAAALAGMLVSAGTAARADSTMYLVPVSDLNASYKPGDSIVLNEMIDLGSSNFALLTVPAAAAYSTTQFGKSKPGVVYDKSLMPGGNTPLWDFPLTSYGTTASGPNGTALSTVTPTPAHMMAKVPVAIPAGTYTLATLTFSIASTYTGSSVSVYLPTAFNYGGTANATDGAYVNGPAYTLAGKNTSGTAISDALTFPNTGGKYDALSFRITPSAVPEPGCVSLLAAGGLTGLAFLRRKSRSI